MPEQKPTAWEKLVVGSFIFNLCLLLFVIGHTVYAKWPRYEIKEQIVSIKRGGKIYLDTSRDKNKKSVVEGFYCDDRVSVDNIGNNMAALENNRIFALYFEGTPEAEGDDFAHCYFKEKVRIN